MLHQTGDLPLRSLTIEQDRARGFYTSMAVTDDFRHSYFKLRKEEHTALPNVLNWLQQHNPWLAAYKHSVLAVHATWQQLQEHLDSAGLTRGIENAMTRRGTRVMDELGAEQLAMLVPLDAMEAAPGTYQAMRAAADTIATSSLQSELPADWKALHENPIKDATGRPLSYLPNIIDRNEAFTKVSFMDVNVEAKIFVRQMRYGTGSMFSTLDSIAIDSHQTYRHHRFWSLDGEFLDDVDPMWMFWQREFEYKHLLSKDMFGKDQMRSNQSAPPTQASTQTTKAHKLRAYSDYRFSDRLGKFVEDSPASLQRLRFEWLAVGHSDNLGTPHSFTTFVGNIHSSAIVAHVRNGPLAKPNPEDALDFVYGPQAAKVPTTKHVCIRAAQYLRDRTRFEAMSDRDGPVDTYHGGRGIAETRRREAQKRGDNHDHYNKWFEPCGLLFSSAKFCEPNSAMLQPDSQSTIEDVLRHSMPKELPRSCADAGESTSSTALPNCEAPPPPLATALPRCSRPSRYCLRAGNACCLPSCLNGSKFHTAVHHADARVELVRPQPLGSMPVKSTTVPDLHGMDIEECWKTLDKNLYTNRRMTCSATFSEPRQAQSTFLVRAQAQWLKPIWRTKLHRDDPMRLDDLVSCFYLRTIQVTNWAHTCKIGHCRDSWTGLTISRQ